MRQDVALAWAEALESGRYPQGREAMRVRVYDDVRRPVGFRYCCLGVLCDISRLGEWNDDDEYLGRESFLPAEVIAWAGLTDNPGNPEDPMIRNVPGELPITTLSVLNDRVAVLADDSGHAWDFRRIAALIRERWAEL